MVLLFIDVLAYNDSVTRVDECIGERKPTYVPTNLQTNNTSGLPYVGSPANHSTVYVSQDLCVRSDLCV